MLSPCYLQPPPAHLAVAELCVYIECIMEAGLNLSWGLQTSLEQKTIVPPSRAGVHMNLLVQVIHLLVGLVRRRKVSHNHVIQPHYAAHLSAKTL